MTTARRFDRAARWGPWLVVAVLPMWVLGRALLTHSTLAYDDLSFWFFPWKTELYQMASRHSFDLWTPYEFCGMPLLADIQRQMLYPPNVVFYLLPTAVAMPVFISLHFLMAGVFCTLLARRLGHSDWGGATAGLIFSASSYLVLHASQLPLMSAAVWMPLAFWVVDRFLERPSASRAVAGGGVLACSILAGSPQVLYIQSIAVGVFLLYRHFCVYRTSDASIVKARVVGLCGMAALGLALVAPQLLSTARLLGYSLRHGIPSEEFAGRLSMPWMRLVGLLLPYYFGNPAKEGSIGAYDFHEVTLYVGGTTLLLAVVGLAASADRMRWMWAGLAGLGIGLALGQNFFLHPLFFHWVPGYSFFRVPARFGILATLGLAMLAAGGMDALKSVALPRPNFPLVFMVLALFGAGLAVVAVLQLNGMAASVAAPFHRMTRDDVAQCLGFLLLWFAAFLLVASNLEGLAGHRWTPLLLILVLLVDLLSFDLSYIRFSPSQEVGSEVAALGQLTVPAGQGRVITNQSSEVPAELGMWYPVFGLSNIQGSNPLVLDYFMDYFMCSQAGEPPDEKHRVGLLDHDGFVLCGPDTQNDMFRMLNLRQTLRWKDGKGTVEEVPGALGSAWAVRSARVIPDRIEILKILFGRQIDPRDEVLLEEKYPDASPARDYGALPAGVEMCLFTADEIRYRVHMPEAGYLVMSEVYYPGWEATVDGAAQPLVRAFGLLRCVYLRAGDHDVTVRFRPPEVAVGWAVAVLAALCSAWLVFRNSGGSRWSRRLD